MMTRLASGGGDVIGLRRWRSWNLILLSFPAPAILWDPYAGKTGIIDATVMDGAERHNPPEHLSNETAALRGA